MFHDYYGNCVIDRCAADRNRRSPVDFPKKCQLFGALMIFLLLAGTVCLKNSRVACLNALVMSLYNAMGGCAYRWMGISLDLPWIDWHVHWKRSGSLVSIGPVCFEVTIMGYLDNLEVLGMDKVAAPRTRWHWASWTLGTPAGTN